MNSAFKISLLSLYMLSLAHFTRQLEKELYLDEDKLDFIKEIYGNVVNFMQASEFFNTENIYFYDMILSANYQKHIVEILSPQFTKFFKDQTDRHNIIRNLQDTSRIEQADQKKNTENQINEIFMADKKEEYELKQLSRINFFHDIRRRYNDIDSFAWNSLKIDLNAPYFQQIDTLYPDYTLYPASQIKLPVWKTVGKSLNLDFPASPAPEHEFLIMSAPIQNELSMNNQHLIPKKISLSTHNKFGETNKNDQNMIYFFRSLIVDNIDTIVAICSDGVLKTIDQNNKFNKMEFAENEKIDVINKCHLYWHTKFEIVTPSETIEISSSSIQNENTNLYNAYKIKIENNNSNEQSVVKEIKLYVLSKWPDHKKLPKHLLPDYLKLLNLLNNKLHADVARNAIRPRIAVHCSAGVGRTGTLISSYQIYTQLKQLGGILDLKNDSTFYQIIQDYVPSTRFYRFFDKHMANGHAELKKSKLLHYMIDNLMYFRLNRMSFIQTFDQFYFMFFFTGEISLDWVNDPENAKLLYPEDVKEIQKPNNNKTVNNKNDKKLLVV